MSFPAYLNKYIQNKEDLVMLSDTLYGFRSHINNQIEDAREKKSTLLIVSGLSGSGKDSVVHRLIENDSRFGWVKTCTTRKRRPEENEGNDTYIRLTTESFHEALTNGDVVESVEYAGNYYCSLTSVFKEVLDKYQFPILRIEPEGSRFYSDLWKRKEWLFNKMSLIYVYIVPPSIEELRERLLKRSGDPSFVEERAAQMEIDLKYISDSQYILVNETGKLDEVVSELMSLFSEK